MKLDLFGRLAHIISIIQKRGLFATKRGGWVLLAAVMCVSLSAWSQESAPKAELWLGYSHLSYYPQIRGSSGRSITFNGGGGSFDWNIVKHFGLKAEFDGYTSTTKTFVIPPATSSFLPLGATVRAQGNMFTYLFGPQVKAYFHHFEPFGQILFGAAHTNFYSDVFRVSGVTSRRPDNNAFAMALGGGVDIRLVHHFSVRPIEVDYLLTRFGNNAVVNNQNNFRYQAGIVFNFGEKEQAAPVSSSLTLEPTEVMAGEAIKATTVPANFPPKNKLQFNWNATGGKIEPAQANASIDTTGLAAGNYTVQVHTTDDKKHDAVATANFTVKEPPKNPPTISCLANPSTLRSGEPSTISCDCKSPDGRTVTVADWKATGGKIGGSGNTATLDTVGLPAGAVTVSTTCSDDRGLNTEANASVNVEMPPPPPPPPTMSKACDIDFSNKNKPAHIDNAAKGCLDGVSDNLLQNPNAKAVVVGEQMSTEKVKELAATRAINAKTYLTSGENQKAIDSSRVEPRTGSADDNKVEVWIVPEGATFDQAGTNLVNPAEVSVAKAEKRRR